MRGVVLIDMRPGCGAVPTEPRLRGDERPVRWLLNCFNALPLSINCR